MNDRTTQLATQVNKNNTINNKNNTIDNKTTQLTRPTQLTTEQHN